MWGIGIPDDVNNLELTQTGKYRTHLRTICCEEYVGKNEKKVGSILQNGLNARDKSLYLIWEVNHKVFRSSLCFFFLVFSLLTYFIREVCFLLEGT